MGNGPANLFKVLLSSLSGSWRIPKANLPLFRAGPSSSQGPLGESGGAQTQEEESEGCQSGWLRKLRDREKVSGLTENISCLCPLFLCPLTEDGGKDKELEGGGKRTFSITCSPPLTPCCQWGSGTGAWDKGTEWGALSQ